MSKHTPGPWAAKSFPAYGYGITAADSQQARDSFAVVHFADTSRGRTTERAKADARLIAAAPDLLEALQNMHLNILEAMRTGGWVPTALHQSFWEAVQESQAAIAKATEDA